MAFPPRFLDEIRARVSLAGVISKHLKLTRKGREYTGLCPFHNEKTPSFTVNEAKGFYHCFGCGAHGSIFDFEININNLSFLEAVEKLASEAGLEMPESTPEQIARTKEQATLYDVTEKACLFFEKQLRLPVGRSAMDYLKKRGLDEKTISHFRLGYAPAGNALRTELLRENIEQERMASAGLISIRDDGRTPYDYFRNRIIFPITDRKNRVIAFGGRVMGDGQPKYLNSPETPVFSKGHVLYGLSQARKSAFEKQEIIVTEGYMDVIALNSAGYENCVAPLGTALTESQMQELWRISPEPILCFDGDNAGRRAALRAADRALPILKPGISFRFAILPHGSDPDDFIHTEGSAAFGDLLRAAAPLSDVVWKKLLSGPKVDTPERRDALEKGINDAVSDSGDSITKQYYRRDLRDRLWQMFSSKRRNTQTTRNKKYWNKEDSVSSVVPAIFPRKDEGKKLLACIICCPEVSGNWLEDYARLRFDNPVFDKIAEALINELVDNPDHSFQTLYNAIHTAGHNKALDKLKTHIEIIEQKNLSLDDANSELEALVTGLQETALSKEINEISKAMETEKDTEAFEGMWKHLQILREERIKMREKHEEGI